MRISSHVFKCCYSTTVKHYLRTYLFIFFSFLCLSILKESYSDVLLILMFLCIIGLSILRAYFSHERRLMVLNDYSNIISNHISIHRRLELIMMELENLPLDTLPDETVVESRSVSKDLINTLPHIPAFEQGSCSVCLDTIECEQIITILPCTHKFHSTCVDNWLLIKPVCPICKTRIN